MGSEFDEVKRYLMRYQGYRDQVLTIEAELVQWRKYRTGISAQSIDGMPGPPGHSTASPVEREAIKLTGLEELRRETVRKAEAALSDVIEVTAALPAPQGRVILLRYIEGWQWQDIAEDIGYCDSRTRDFHRAALETIQAKINEK